ncbi:LytR/AlgR family response regulator transcription factor [Desertivirga arenae]|uniref:LytR/AlgR family response regulator transcription factor n=1 Tax=Desertivirga arenae TaxID=2810309 RepID=UPI001A97155A|nr:LytTR family DNA-binding domain-containing protein [Pedobacter sp. SYSU D00823]
MVLNALIVDDEEYSRKSLYFLLQENCPEVTIGAIAKSVAEARNLIEEQQFQLVFLDIAMPKENGFELLPTLQKRNIMVIFTTAYDQYALKALKAEAVDYLLKPIDIVELKTAVAKAVDWAELIAQKDNDQVRNEAIRKEEKSSRKLSIPSTHGFNVLETDDIIYLEADSNYTNFHLKNGEKVIISKPLKEFEDSLSNVDFIRIHKSVMVNFKFVQGYSNKNGLQIFLTNNVNLPVSRRRSSDFLDRAKQYFNR